MFDLLFNNIRDKARMNRLIQELELSIIDIVRAGIKVWEDRKEFLPITKDEIEKYL